MTMLSSALALGAAMALSLSAAQAQDTAAPATPATATPDTTPPAAAAAADQGAAGDEADEALRRQIIVEGERRLEPEEIGKAAEHLTRRTGLFAPVARFETPLCVMVYGLGEQLNEAVADRIRENVRAVGLVVDKEADCRPNAIAMISNDPQASFETLQNKRAWILGWPFEREYSLVTLKAQLREKRPAVSWAIFGPWMQDNAALAATQPQAGSFWGWNTGRMPSVGAASRGMAVVLIDAKRINGVRVHQLADFATVHLLGSPRATTSPSEAGVPTILSLFDGNPKHAPQRLTTFDRAYLCGLHRIRQRGTNLVINLARNTRMKQNMLDVYDSECVRVGAPAD